MNIDEIAQNIVSAFNAGDKEKLKIETEQMLNKIDRDENMFSIVKRPYIVAKSLYFMMTEDFLSEDEQIACVKLAYFCLLKNYLKNKDRKMSEPEYEDLVSGSKLAIVLISMQYKYLIYSVIAGQAHYVNPYTHMRNQILLFGGIVKEAEISHCNYPLEEVIRRYFTDIFKESYSQLPSGKDLLILKENSDKVIKNIETNIRDNFKEDCWEDFI